MSLAYNERRRFELNGWSYLLDDNDHTAWIRDGHSGGQAVFVLPTSVEIDGHTYMVTSVEMGAFYEDPFIEELIVHDGIGYIDSEAFHQCPKLRKVHIGKGLMEFCFWCFAGSPIEEMTIDNENPNLKMSDDGTMVLSKDGCHLYYVVIGKTELVIPEGVEVLGVDSISCHQGVEKIILPSTLKRISSEAIAECRNLKELVIPEGVTEIGLQAFRDCDELRLLDFPSSVTNLGYESFAYNRKLVTIILRSNQVVILYDDAPKGIPTDSCLLFVPKELIEFYKHLPFWKTFANIKPIE